MPSVVRFAVNLVRWPEWASALRIFSGYLLTLHNGYNTIVQVFLQNFIKSNLKTTHWSSPPNSRGVSWKHSSVTSFIPPWGI